MDKPQVALVGEAGAEAIIPLEGNLDRARDLWVQAGERLNAFAAVSGRTTGDARRAQIVNNSTDAHREMHFAEGSVVIQTQATNGDAIYNQFITRMERESRRKEVAYGRG